MENQSDKCATFIITGMHRSGTSLTSSLMESAGINVGKRLIGASHGNPKGHFENLDFVEFHQRVLDSQCLNREGWTLQSKISIPQQFHDEAKLIVEKNAMSQFWGWKDPRTTLFLDFWNNLLPQAYFIFTYRSPWEVVDSLYRRGDEVFDTNPKYALEIWTHYNRLILDFHRRFPDQSILLNIETLIADPDCIFKLCKSKFGLDFKDPNQNIIEKSLMGSLDASSYRSLLIKKVFPEAIELFHELNGQSDLKHQLFIAEDAENNESFRDWAFKDWIDISRINRNHQLASNRFQQSQFELRQSQSELRQSQLGLHQAQSELYQVEIELNQSQSELQHHQNIISAMETSKFWKLRKIWFRLKQVFSAKSASYANIIGNVVKDIENIVKDEEQDSLYARRFPNLKPLKIFSILSSERRINLVTDSINSGSLYGGVGTAIIFCTLLAEKWNCKLRLITRTEKAQEHNFFEILKANNIKCTRNVEFAFDSIGEDRADELDIHQEDIFVTTSWWTTWSTLKSISPAQIIYILQEDERMFYAHGDDYLHCEQILVNSEIQFVVNSKQLFEHFIAEGFYNIKEKGLWFEPAFNKNLYFCEQNEQKKKKKNFFFYARPNNPRNLFYFGLEVIDSAVRQGILDLDEWELFFIGKDIPLLKIAGFYEPKRIEGLNWVEYAKFIRSVDLGLCLMYTPHPSYPPLDLAASGSVVVTNRFGIKKELDTYSSNIICKDTDIDSMVQGIADGIVLSANPTIRTQNFEKNQILQDWEISFEQVIATLVED